MNLHEFQAKEILRAYGIFTPAGGVAQTPEAAEDVTRRISAPFYAVKAQVHAGGRGDAGGVRLVKSPAEVKAAASELLGRRLVTSQTGPAGRIVRRVYVEAGIDSKRFLYLAVLVDHARGKVILLGSPVGGEDVKGCAAPDPDALQTLTLDDLNPETADFAEFAGRLGLGSGEAWAVGAVSRALCEALIATDASLIEINPLALTDLGAIALDVKMSVDDNALFRHPHIADLRDADELDPAELEAQRYEINLVPMDGDIGVVVNGAGLALATLDMLCDAGGRPANFMDIRTTATSLQIAHGIDLVIADRNVRVLLVNIHGGGMTRCDTVAEALGISMRRASRTVPVIYRAAGNNAVFSRTVLRNCGLDVIEATDMADAVMRAVRVTQTEAV